MTKNNIDYKRGGLVDILSSLNPKVLNIIGTQVDPDFLCAAMAFVSFVKSLDKNFIIRIFTCGGVSHDQNQTLIEMYKMPLQDIESFGEEDNINVVFLDSHSLNDSRLPAHLRGILNWCIIIDHHMGELDIDVGHDKFVWIDDQAKSTSTLISEVLYHSEGSFGGVDTSVVTMLFIGIYSDTIELATAGNRDRKMYSLLSEFINKDEFMKFKLHPHIPEYKIYLGRAVNSMQVRHGIMVVGAGIMRAKHLDALVTIANDLIRSSDIIRVVAWGINFNKRKIRLVIRSKESEDEFKPFIAQYGQKAGYKVGKTGLIEAGGLFDLMPQDRPLPQSNRVMRSIARDTQNQIWEQVFGPDFEPLYLRDELDITTTTPRDD